MSMILAPYNDAMRIGQGFNSYTHEMCIDGAVLVDGDHDEKTQARTVVSYSARAVEKLSDVIQTMNISYPHSIKKGSVTVSGSNTAIDEATFKSADINIIVTVKVTNQTTLIKSNARFVPLKDVEPGSQEFHDSYGDSYISGFIQGGEFTGIISIKVLDRSNVDLTVKKIKARLDAKDNSATSTGLNLNSNDLFSSTGSASVMGKTESHIHVSWMGGGQIKNENTPWDIDSIFKTAAAFPQRVSERPQRTWAILTKYKSNRSFMDWASIKQIKTLEYDLIGTYTAELFDSYMDYKILLKYVQLIIDNPESYEAVDGKDAFDTSIETLLGVRLYMRQQQAMIVEAISLLGRDPGILERQDGWATTRLTTSLSRFMSQAKGCDISLGVVKARHEAAEKKSSTTPDFNFNALIPADLWKKWLPVPKSDSAPSTEKPSKGSEEHPFSGVGPPPSDDLNWGKSSQTRDSGSSKSGDNVAVLQGRVDALVSDLQRKTDEHAGLIDKLKSDHVAQLESLRETHKGELESKSAEQATKLQGALDKLKANDTDLADLRKKHDEETEIMNHKLSAYVNLEAEGKSEIDKTIERLTKDKNEAINALEKKKQDEYDDLKTKYDALEEQKRTEMLRVEKEKKDELDALRQDKDATYKNLDVLYRSLKDSSDKLTKENAALTSDKNKLTSDKDNLTRNNNILTAQNGSLTTQLDQKNTAYNILSGERTNLKALYEPTNDAMVAKFTKLTTEYANLTTKYVSLTTEWNNLNGINDKLKTKMRWAELTEDSLQHNCLPNGYNGWYVMILMPHSWMALNANKDSQKMAHAWEFDMTSNDEQFRLDKADDKPNTAWTITSVRSGRLLTCDDNRTGTDIRVRDKNDPAIRGLSAHWYIGRGAEKQFTWVFKNAQWNTCIKLQQGWNSDGRGAWQQPYCNDGDANWVIIPLGRKPEPKP
ncbi:hypothetical protein FPOAC2_02007 [Fusarium poae]|uniref:hypothetical protein n=1 Tax=Fusarium poae TaxID=36050 RepID=UPI001CE9FB98|nr:hypothetical protein FPOAC1_001920 [Fusarium poae]KAG8675925.1 hypothetical protein FPOAC1_001920 [Fusarium poae]